jgi:hypothetical protein
MFSATGLDAFIGISSSSVERRFERPPSQQRQLLIFSANRRLDLLCRHSLVSGKPLRYSVWLQRLRQPSSVMVVSPMPRLG